MKKKKPVLASHQSCTGCMACVDSCNFSALSKDIAKDGHIYPVYNSQKCVTCGCCTKVCPIVNNFSYTSECPQSKPYAAWAKDDELRIQSASGGIFAALATKIISEGGCAVGAVMDGVQVKHLLIDKIEDLPKLQGSKYQQGDLTGIYRLVKQRLKAGQKVLFSGTGCQVGALYSYLGNKRFDRLLYTVDIICGGFPSIFPMYKLLDNSEKQVLSIKSFRDKSNGWKSKGFTYTLKTINVDGTETNYGSRNLVLGAFSSHLTNRYSCSNCKFAYAQRKSDLTIADFWGDSDYPKEHYKGLSVVVVHSSLGYYIMNSSNVESHSITWGKFLPNNPRCLYTRSLVFKLHPSRWIYPYLFKYCSYKLLIKLFHGSDRSLIWLPYLAILVFLEKMDSIFMNKSIRKMITKLDYEN